MPVSRKSKKELTHDIRELQNKLIELDYEKVKRKQAEDALKESGENFRALADNAYDGIAIAKGDGKFVYVNKRAIEMTGFTEKELLRSTIRDLTHPDEIRQVMKRYRKRIKGKSVPSQYEARLIRKNGEVIPIELTASNTVWQGEPADMAIFRDITGRKQAEEALTKSEEQYRQLVNNINDGVYTLDEKGYFTYVNKIIEDRIGLSLEKLRKMKFIDILIEKHRAPAKENFEKIMEGKAVPLFELDHRSNSGEILNVEFNTRPVYEDGKIVGLQGISRDITERKKAEEALIESEEKFRNLAEKSPNMIFIHNFQKIVYVNEECVKEMGYTGDEFYSATFNFVNLIAPESRKLVMKAFDNHKKGKDVEPYEYSLVTKKGKRIESIITTKLIKYGGTDAILGIVTDITEQKQTEERLKEGQMQLRRAIDALPDAVHVIDKDLKIVMLNKAFQKWNEELGFKTDVIGMKLKKIFPFLTDRVFEEYRRVFETEETIYTEEQTNIKGKDYFTETVKIPIIERGEVTQIITVIRDITGKKEAEDELRESAEKFKVLADQNFMAILILQDNIVKYANQAASELSGYSIPEILSWKAGGFAKLVHKNDKKFVLEQASKKQMGDTKDIVDRYSFRVHTKNKEVKWVELYSKTIQYKGKPADFITLIDISDKKKDEERK